MFRLLIIFLFAFSVYAKKNPVATVVKVRGKVTQLRPGALIASRLKLGDKLTEDTSVLTGRGSFVRIRFVDSSTVNLGPKSKFVINKIKKNEAGIITLLKGKLRTKVKEENDSKKNKFFIKTQTAALGVRGTDFQTIYNPENKITNLLTYNGKVAIKKIESEQMKRDIDETTSEVEGVTRSSTGDFIVQKKVSKSLSSEEKLEKLLAREDVVVVKGGQFSGASESQKMASSPVMISPVQLTVLYKNDEFLQKKKNRMRPVDVDKFDQKQFLLKQEPQEVPPEGFYDKKTGHFAPKAGGLIDLETGLYIPPTDLSSFDKKRGIYMPKVAGKIDGTTGEYVIPKGLKLDSKKGFVPKGEQSPELIAMSKGLNSSLLISKPKTVTKVVEELYSSKELFAKDIVGFEVFTFSYEQDLTNNSMEGDRSLLAEDSNALRISWNHSTGGIYQPMTGLEFKKIEFTQYSSDFSKPDGSLIHMFLGLRRFLGNRWNLEFLAALDQEFVPYYLDNSGSLVKEFKRATIPKVKLGFAGRLLNYKRFRLHLSGHGTWLLEKETADLKTKQGFGAQFELGGQYYFSPKKWLELKLRSLAESQKIEATSFTADLTRKVNGLALNFNFLL